MNSNLPLHTCEYTEEVFRLLGKRWMGLLIDLLLQRPARFSELRDALPQLSNRVLTERLGELQEAGIACRETSGRGGATVTYCLTEKGRGLGPAMAALRIWAGADEADPRFHEAWAEPVSN
ncbi:helix-turn-helix domain-containing protein [Microbacterium sp. ARD31]|uniref:winged helix-turn-helix transcriptional regulator n=1 Tax=Microbacterium sp. ARD31 TaxID=2962576 RepID=UPI002881F0EF|nr:helix-turn-helix domain-containing protein [Microbacterium sp. ARD31]MDT0184005.1 helix-turn-helix domain-containing protein [Microbacterium sp. ARD31]